MERVKRVVCILVCLSSAVVACTREDPAGGKRGRPFGPRLSSAGDWAVCCTKVSLRMQCDEPIRNRQQALTLLEDAHGECLDHVMEAVKRYAQEDLSAAYFIHAQRARDPVDFLLALEAANRNPRSRTALFNRALALEKLGLVSEAINAWNEVANVEDSAWSREAVLRRDARGDRA